MTGAPSMRLLIGSAPSKLFHQKEFAAAMSRKGSECKVVIDADVYDGFPNLPVSSWFQTAKRANLLFDEFGPDAVLVDRNGHFAKAALDRGLPLLVQLRGDYWSEMQWRRETIGKNPVKRVGRYIKSRMEERCFRESSSILPICNYLRDIVERRYPSKPAGTIYQGIDPARWDNDSADGMDLKHPCVGLLQSANIWGKAREMLVLPRVMEALPDVTFYWAGDGPYRDKILPTLSEYGNFVWLGNLDYPDAVRRYLAEIDMYALISGIDMSPLTLQEAQLAQKPVVATDVGGIPELMEDRVTGFLVKRQNADDVVARISELLCDENRARQMGRNGRRFVQENFNWDKICGDFVSAVNPVIN